VPTRYLADIPHVRFAASSFTPQQKAGIMKTDTAEPRRRFRIERLEERIAPSEIGKGLGNGNPGNNNPPLNNTNNPGNEGTGGAVSTG
jgi:hypothetical protein